MVNQTTNNVVRVEFSNAKITKKLFEAITALKDQIRLNIYADKIEICFMDGSHISLMCVKLDALDVNITGLKEKMIQPGINVEDLLKILKRCGDEDQLTLEFPQADKKCRILIENEEKKVKEYNIGLIDIEPDEINMDNLDSMEFPNKILIEFKTLDEAIKDAEILSEVLSFKINEDILTFSSSGSLGDFKSNVELDSYRNELQEGQYAIVFLKSILKSKELVPKEPKSRKKDAPLPSEPKFQLSLKSEAPLKIVVEFLKQSKVIYYLAPRVEESCESEYEESIPAPKKEEVKVEVHPHVEVPVISTPIQANYGSMQEYAEKFGSINFVVVEDPKTILEQNLAKIQGNKTATKIAFTNAMSNEKFEQASEICNQLKELTEKEVSLTDNLKLF